MSRAQTIKKKGRSSSSAKRRADPTRPSGARAERGRDAEDRLHRGQVESVGNQ